MYELGSDDSGLRIRKRLSNRNKSNHVFESDTASFSGAVMWFWEGKGGGMLSIELSWHAKLQDCLKMPLDLARLCKADGARWDNRSLEASVFEV